jgi:hypothetical protein
VVQTDAVNAQEVAAFIRLARYWDVVANSGRFKSSLAMILDAPSPFLAFAHFSDWLWRDLRRTHGLTPEILVDAQFVYLCQERGLAAERVRSALIADYAASGARAMPKVLQGFLPRRSPTASAVGVRHNERQQRHAVNALP